jgi:hypothetical protein
LPRNRPRFSLESARKLRIRRRTGRHAVLTNRIDYHRVAVGKCEVRGERGISRNVVSRPLGSFAAARGKSQESEESNLGDVHEMPPILHLIYLCILAERSDGMLFSPP